MIGIGDSFEEPVGGVKNGKGKFGTVDQRSEALVVALARLSEEYGLDGVARAESFFDKADAFDTDVAVGSGKPSAEGYAKQFEPAIVAARDASGFAAGAGCARSLFRLGHYRGG